MGYRANGALPELLKLFHETNASTLKASIVTAMSNIDPDGDQFKRVVQLSTIGSNINSISPEIIGNRVWACKRLEELGGRAPQWSASYLRRILNVSASTLAYNGNEEVSLAAIAALVRIGADDASTVRALRELLRSESRQISTAADTALRQLQAGTTYSPVPSFGRHTDETIDHEKASRFWEAGLAMEKEGDFDGAYTYYCKATRFMDSGCRPEAVLMLGRMNDFLVWRRNIVRQDIQAGLTRPRTLTFYVGSPCWYGGGTYIYQHIIESPAAPAATREWRGF